jgi:hypothetical protein
MAPKERQKIEIEKTHRDLLLSFNQAVTVDCSDFLGTALLSSQFYKSFPFNTPFVTNPLKKVVYQTGASCPLHSETRRRSAITMGEAGGELTEHKVDWELEFAKLAVNIAFAYWLWCQKRLNKLVNSYDGNSSLAWLSLFAEVRRASRNAQFSWVAALCEFRRLVEKKSEKSAQEEN